MQIDSDPRFSHLPSAAIPYAATAAQDVKETELGLISSLYTNFWNGTAFLADKIKTQVLLAGWTFVLSPVLAKKWAGDKAYLQELTGSDEIFIWISDLSKFLPDFIKQTDRENILRHLFASSARRFGEEKNSIPAEELFILIISSYEQLITESLAEVKAKAVLEGRPAAKEDFTWVAGKIMSTLLPESYGFFAEPIEKILFECYSSVNAVSAKPQFSHYGEEITFLVDSAVDYTAHKMESLVGLNEIELFIHDIISPRGDEKVRKALAHYLILKKPLLQALKAPAANFLSRKIAEIVDRSGCKSLTQFLGFANTQLLHGPEGERPKQLFDFFAGSLAAESLIPVSLRSTVTELLSQNIIPKYIEYITPWLEILGREGEIKEDLIAKLGFKAEAEKFAEDLVEKYYPQLFIHLPQPFNRWIKPALGKRAVREVLLHVLNSYARTIPHAHPSTFPAFIEGIFQFVITEVETTLTYADKNAYREDLRRDQFKLNCNNIVNSFLPGGLAEKLGGVNFGVTILEEVWKSSRTIDKTGKLGSVLPLFKGVQAEAEGFCYTVDSLLHEGCQFGSKRLDSPLEIFPGLNIRLQIPQFLWQKVNDLSAFVLYTWANNISTTYRSEDNSPFIQMLIVKLPEFFRALPDVAQNSLSAEWIGCSRLILCDFPEQVPFKKDLEETFLPVFLVQNKDLVSSLIRNISSDMYALTEKPHGLPVNRPLNDYLTQEIAVQMLAKIPEGHKKLISVSFLRPLIERVSQHFLSRAMAEMQVSTLHEAGLRLFQKGIQCYRESGVRGLAGSLIRHTLPGLLQYSHILENILVPYIQNLPQNQLEPFKQNLREVLWDPSDYRGEFPRIRADEPINFETSRLVGLEIYVEEIVQFTEGFAFWIIPLVQSILSKGASLPGPLADLIRFLLATETAEGAIVKNSCHRHLKNVLLKGAVNLVAALKTEDPLLKKENIPFAAFNKIVLLISLHTPERKEATDPQNWIPLSHALTSLFFPDFENLLPLPADESRQVAVLVKNKILPNLFLEWHTSLHLFLDQKEKYQGILQETFQTNHVALFSDKMSTIWIRDFVPHVLIKFHTKISTAALDKINTLFRIRLSPETASFFGKTIEHIAMQHKAGEADKSAMTLFSEFLGKYSEAFMLKMFSEVFYKVNSLDVTLQTVGEGSIILEVMKKAVPAMSDFYSAIKELKDEHHASHGSNVPYPDLVAKLREKGLLNEAFPDEAALTEEQKDERRLRHFIGHASKILGFAQINEASAPFPEPLKEIGMEFLKEMVIGQTILAIEKIVLENRGAMLLTLFRSIKSAARYIEDDVPGKNLAAVPQIVLPNPVLNQELGLIVRHLLAYLPDQWFAPLTELSQLKGATDEQLGKAFISVLHDESLTQRVNEGIESILPKIVPGRIVKMGANVIAFEPSIESVDFTPSLKPDEAELIKQIKKDGSEAFMRSLEKAVREYVRGKKDALGNSITNGLKYISHEKMHSSIDAAGYVINLLIDYLMVPIFTVVTYIPYQLFRLVLKLLLARLAKAYYNEFQRDYHEDILLNVMDKIFNEIGTKHRAASA